MFLFVWPGATWDPWKSSASALNGHPRLKKNEINKQINKIQACLAFRHLLNIIFVLYCFLYSFDE